MAAGIEAAGLALAVLPVIIEIIDWYSGSITGRDTKFLAESLKSQELIFLNAVEALLRSVVSAAQLRTLLRDVGGESWKDAGITARVVECLGTEAGGILENISSIHKTVLNLKEKLPVSTYSSYDQSLSIARNRELMCLC